MKKARTLSFLMAAALLLCSCGQAGSSSAPASSAPSSSAAASESSADSQAPAASEAPAEEGPKGSGTFQTYLGASETPSNDPNTIKIGVMSYLSDARATQGKLFRLGWETGAQMAIKNLGLHDMNVEFILFDPTDDAGILKQRLTELKDMGCVAILHSCGDGLAPTSAEWAAENNFPVINGTNTSTKTTMDHYSPYMFNVATNAWALGKAFALGAVGNEGKENFVYIGRDGAACQDAITFLTLEGQKINPDFEMLADYRVSNSDSEFTSVISAAMSLEPDMVLEQGAGNTLVSFMQQAVRFGMTDTVDIYADFLYSTADSIALYQADALPIGHCHSVFALPYWDESFMTGEIAEYCDIIYNSDLAKEMDITPTTSLTNWRAASVALRAVQACLDEGLDYTDPEVLTDAIWNLNWSDSTGDHYFRDFDNQLTFTYFYGTVDGYDDGPTSSDIISYTAEEALPTKADMKAYAESIGFDDKGRFD